MKYLILLLLIISLNVQSEDIKKNENKNTINTKVKKEESIKIQEKKKSDTHVKKEKKPKPKHKNNIQVENDPKLKIQRENKQLKKGKKVKTPDETCVELYQAWVLNSGIEEICEYSPLLTMKLALVAKASCGDMMPEKRAYKLAGPVIIALRKDISEMGKEHFCKEARVGYENLLDVIINDK